MAMTNATEIQHMRDAITDASKQSHATPLTDDYIDPTGFSGSVNILASSLTGSETDYNCHQNDFVTHIQSLRHPGNQEICDTQTGDITVPTSCPKNSAEYRAAYLSGIHPELNVYTPDGQYCQGTMFHHPGTESMTTTAGCQNPSYCLKGTGVTWNDTSVVHNYGTACVQFQCGGYVSPNTEWSFNGANCYNVNCTQVVACNNPGAAGSPVASNFKAIVPDSASASCKGVYFPAGYYAEHWGGVNFSNAVGAANTILYGYCLYGNNGRMLEGTYRSMGCYGTPTTVSGPQGGSLYWGQEPNGQSIHRCCLYMIPSNTSNFTICFGFGSTSSTSCLICKGTYLAIHLQKGCFTSTACLDVCVLKPNDNWNSAHYSFTSCDYSGSCVCFYFIPPSPYVWKTTNIYLSSVPSTGEL